MRRFLLALALCFGAKLAQGQALVPYYLYLQPFSGGTPVQTGSSITGGACGAGDFVSAISVAGVPTCGTPSAASVAVGDITGLGSGVATWLASATSANLRAAMTDEVGGAGLLMFNINPTVVGLTTGNGSTTGGWIDFYEDTDDGTNKVRLITDTQGSDITVTLPFESGTLTTRAGTEQLQNKTIIGPVILGGNVNNGIATAGYLDFDEDGSFGTEHVRLIGANTLAANVTLTLPAETATVATTSIWDAAGDLAVGTGADTAAALSIGLANKVLTSTGTTAAWDYPQPAGEDLIYLHEDFICGSQSATGMYGQCFQWAFQVSGGAWTTPATGSTTNPGWMRCTLDANADACGTTSTQTNVLLMDGFRWRSRLILNQLSNDVENFTVWAGGNDMAANSATAPTNGVFFSYTNNTANATPNWMINVWDTGTDTGPLSCGIAATTNYVKLDIRYDTGTGVHFYVDGVECSNSPINTDLPQTSGSEDFRWSSIKFAKTTHTATASTFDIDYVTLGPTPMAR